MKRALRLPALIAAGLLFAGAFASNAWSQDYPNRSITVIVPFPAGGPSDVVARIVTDQMGRTLGQTMVIENVGGAGGVIGSGRVATAQADGYTLLAGSMGSHVAAPVLTQGLRYNPLDFTPIGPTAPSSPCRTARRYSQSRQIFEPSGSVWPRRLFFCTRKQDAQVNSSSWRGLTSTLSSSPERSWVGGSTGSTISPSSSMLLPATSAALRPSSESVSISSSIRRRGAS